MTAAAKEPDWLDVFAERGSDALQNARAQATAWEPPPEEPTREAGRQPEDEGTASQLPAITTVTRPLRDITTDALAAITTANDPPELFVRGGRLARVREDERGRPIIDVVGEHELSTRLARVANFRNAKNQDVPPPLDVVRDVLAVGMWPALPALERIIEVPVLRPDGSVLTAAGYDPDTGLVYKPAIGLAVPTIPAAPTRADTSAARDFLLDDLLVDFPFADEASLANMLGLLVTPIVRTTFQGLTPLALLDKPLAGTGASLLAEIASLIATGRPGAMMGAPRDEEEWRKQITAILLDGATFVVIDNVVGPFRSAQLARALTSTTWKDRVLGRNLSVELPQRATWLATGNNIRLGGDLARRSYWIRLNAQMARPWQRTGFKQPDLRAWPATRRGDLLAALLTLARAWFAAGCPKPTGPTIGGFGEWTTTVGGVLAYAGIEGFLGNLDDLYDRVDEEAASWEAFLGAWFERFGEQPIKTADVETEIRRTGNPLREALPNDLAAALADPNVNFTLRLGQALRGRVDQVHRVGEGLEVRLERAEDDRNKKVARWRVVRVLRGSAGVFPLARMREKAARQRGEATGVRPAEPPQTSATPAPPADDPIAATPARCQYCDEPTDGRDAAGLPACPPGIGCAADMEEIDL